MVVDVDLEKFFDRVDHDILMGRLRWRIVDRAAIRLIRAYLDAGTLINAWSRKAVAQRRKAARCRHCRRCFCPALLRCKKHFNGCVDWLHNCCSKTRMACCRACRSAALHSPSSGSLISPS